MIPLCLRTARSNGHSDNFLLIFFKPLGILDTEGKFKKNILKTAEHWTYATEMRTELTASVEREAVCCRQIREVERFDDAVQHFADARPQTTSRLLNTHTDTHVPGP